MPMEVANVMRRIESRGKMDASRAAAAWADLRRLAVDLFPFSVLADRVWELRANVTVYDACYVAAAEQVGGRLVTLDRRLASAPGLRCRVDVPPAAGAP
jgi:predicted nucleic acid-binding protein